MNQKIILLTPAEMEDLIISALNKWGSEKQNASGNQVFENEYLTSIAQMAEFLDCSQATAQKIKNEHGSVFAQSGRKFMVSKTELLNTLKIHKDHGKHKQKHW